MKYVVLTKTPVFNALLRPLHECGCVLVPIDPVPGWMCKAAGYGYGVAPTPASDLMSRPHRVVCRPCMRGIAMDDWAVPGVVWLTPELVVECRSISRSSPPPREPVR